MSTIKKLKLKLRATLLQIMDKEKPATFDLAILKVIEAHDVLEEDLEKANKRIENLQGMLRAGSEPSLQEN